MHSIASVSVNGCSINLKVSLPACFNGGNSGIDNDGDGYYDDAECDDNDGNVWMNLDLYIDNDGDGYDDGTGTQPVCTDSNVPSGYVDFL